jgi:myo-inositol-1(or 4)-monophosphatase
MQEYREVLTKIGQRLLRVFEQSRHGPLIQVPLGVGASGDKTYPIDKIAEEVIISGLESSGLPCSIVSEEYGFKEIKGGGKKVLIDPVDGSKNAVSGIPFYCTSIAVADGDSVGSVEMAYVINLISGDEFWAEKGNGAFMNGNRVSTQGDEEFYLIAYEAQVPSKDIARILPLLSKSRKTRCLGATALDLSYLAYGAVSIFANPAPSRSFDFAGGLLLVREAGGVVTNLEGGSIDHVPIGLERSTSLLASGNERLHEKALFLLRS